MTQFNQPKASHLLTRQSSISLILSMSNLISSVPLSVTWSVCSAAVRHLVCMLSHLTVCLSGLSFPQLQLVKLHPGFLDGILGTSQTSIGHHLAFSHELKRWQDDKANTLWYTLVSDVWNAHTCRQNGLHIHSIARLFVYNYWGPEVCILLILQNWPSYNPLS